jgi:hypothetical protein
MGGKRRYVGPEPSKNTGCGNNWGELDGFMGLLCWIILKSLVSGWQHLIRVLYGGCSWIYSHLLTILRMLATAKHTVLCDHPKKSFYNQTWCFLAIRFVLPQNGEINGNYSSEI